MFIIILGILVFVHEFGHFIIAKRNGIKVHEFGLGFPKNDRGTVFRRRGKQKFSEIESLELKKSDIKIGNEEIIQETITEKIHTVEKKCLSENGGSFGAAMMAMMKAKSMICMKFIEKIQKRNRLFFKLVANWRFCQN